MTRVLQNWLLLLAWLHLAIGLAIPVIAYSALFGHYSALLQAAFWPGQEVPAATIEFQRWFAALFGPTLASVGVVMIYLVKAGIKYADPWPWDAILIALAVWAPGDIFISLINNFWLHVQIDVGVLLAIVPATIILRVQAIGQQRQFHP